MKNKVKYKFIKLRTFEFYPTILLNLLDRPISFTKSLIDIEWNIINAISQARKSLLFDDTEACIKNDRKPLFDVAINLLDCTI